MRLRALLLRTLQEEGRLLQHLASAVAPDRLDFRFSPGQRSTRELLRYLASCAIGPTRAILEGDWARSTEELEALPEAMDAPTFEAAMGEQIRRVTDLVGGLSDEELETRQVTMPWNPRPLHLGEALLEMPVKFLTAYRMQLFLQLKASGATGLSTRDLWMGLPPEQAGAAGSGS